jgi:hypothetical protein
LFPDWRAFYAGLPAKDIRSEPFRHDALLLAYRRYLSLKPQAGHSPARRIRKQFAGIDSAHLLRQNPIFDRELQSRIFARCSTEEIAAHFGLLPAVVSVYEKLFVDVRNRLDATGLIIVYLFGLKDDELRLKLSTAYHLGREFLDALQRMGPLSEELRQKMQQVAEDQITKQGFMATFTRPVTEENAGQIISEYFKERRLEQTERREAQRDRSSSFEKALAEAGGRIEQLEQQVVQQQRQIDALQAQKASPPIDMRTEALRRLAIPKDELRAPEQGVRPRHVA